MLSGSCALGIVVLVLIFDRSSNNGRWPQMLACIGSAADLCKAAMIQVERALAARTDLQARFDDTFYSMKCLLSSHHSHVPNDVAVQVHRPNSQHKFEVRMCRRHSHGRRPVIQQFIVDVGKCAVISEWKASQASYSASVLTSCDNDKLLGHLFDDSTLQHSLMALSWHFSSQFTELKFSSKPRHYTTGCQAV